MSRFFVMIAALFFMVTAAHAEIFITIYKTDQTMYVDTPEGSFVWKVSTARPGYNTPTGRFQPTWMTEMHYSSKYENSPMPNSIFFYNGYAIHATYDIKHLGRPASHGCVRLSPQNARWLYRMIEENGMNNTFIEIID